MKKEKFIPIPTANLRLNTILNFNIYIQQKNHFVLFRKEYNPFSEEALFKLVENRINTIFISENDIGKFEKYFYSIQENKIASLTEDGFAPPIFDKPENVKKYFNSYLNYYPIGNKTFIPGSKVNFNVYKKKEFDVELYFGHEDQNGKSGTVPEDIQKSNLPVMIQNSDIPLYKKYLESLTREYSKKEGVSLELKCNIIQENSKLIIKEVIDDPRNGENIKKSWDVVDALVDMVLNNEKNFYNLLKITSHDYYTYVHSLNVCTISIGLGMALNLKRYPDIVELGWGALLHDIGKNAVGLHIINKPGRLTEEEYKTVQDHVILGKRLLEASDGKISKKAFIPILQHHEKLSGKGYPNKLKGEQIHLHGRIAAIVDFFDAITTERPYKKACTPFEALQLISENQEDYDMKLLKNFIMMLGQQS